MQTENTKTEVQILTEKLHSRIDTGKQRSQQYLNLIESDGNLLQDHIIGVGKNNAISFEASENEVRMLIQNGEKKNFTLHKNAINQLGAKLNMTPAYIQKLTDTGTEWSNKLAAHCLNVHSENTDRQRVLVRSVNNEVRGFLSDQYRRLNTADIYARFIQGCRSQNLEIYDAYADDLKSYIEAVTPGIFTIPGQNGLETHIAYGVRISNSDFGAAAMQIRAFIIQVVCLNGMVRDSILKQVHLGSRLPDNISLSDRTYKLDTQTTGSAVHDIINQLFSKQNLLTQSTQIQNAMSMNVDYDKELVKLNKVGINKEEIKEVKDVLIAHRKADGIIGEGSTLWNLSQGVSAVARGKDGARKRDLEEIAGTLLNNVK